MSLLDTAVSLLDIRMATSVLVFLATFLGIYLLWGANRRPKLPPGPVALPLLGNMLQFAGVRNAFKLILSYRQRYGDMVTIKVGSMVVVLVCGHKLIREALVDKGNAFLGRPNRIYILHKLFQGNGVMWSVGQRWKNLRRFALMTMRNFGVGKKSLEERVQDEVRIIADEMKTLREKPFWPKPFFAKGVANILISMVFGSRFDYNDADFLYVLDLMDYLFKNAGIQVPENFFPWIAHFRRESPAAKLIQNDEKMREFVKQKIAEHRLTFDPDSPRDFIDIYLKVTEDQESDLKVSERDMFRVVVDLFQAGSETTATSLRWLILYLVNHSEIQEKCWQEINRVVGSGRMTALSDKNQLPYIQATINEVLRLASIAPATVPHTVTEEVELGGYRLQKDDIVIFQLYASHRDPAYWPDPDEFKPERWIDSEGGLIKHKSFFPFGIGPRACMGEPLAQMELFLFFTNLLQRFQFKLPEGQDKPSLEGVQTGITVQPQYHEVVALPRE